MLRKLFFVISLTILLTACQEGRDNDIASDSIELQRKANEETALGIAEGNNERLEKAKILIEQSLEADPGNHFALINRAQIAIYQGNYELALSTVEQAYDIAPSNDSLPLFRCMLIEEVESNESARECYSTVEASYAELHEAGEEIPANWMSAAILADSHAAPELAEAYLEQEKAKGKMEAEIAEMTIESLQDGSYVDQVLMR
ncbi:tetratricopeptide repeat protein [Billgrantia desiderata]|uniref:tetratricopeptide repeat protein n=1 Tax=Billgrantia desiderata TaxID=52021 RepID=UPI003F3EA8FE